MVTNDGSTASTRPSRHRETRPERRFRGGPDRDRRNQLSEVFAPFAAKQPTALGCRHVQALRRSRLSLPVTVAHYPRVSQVNRPGLATGRTTEVVNKQMRAGGGMVSDNFSSSCPPRGGHDISIENTASDFENRFTASRNR
jgi:hypothetical protein